MPRWSDVGAKPLRSSPEATGCQLRVRASARHAPWIKAAAHPMRDSPTFQPFDDGIVRKSSSRSRDADLGMLPALGLDRCSLMHRSQAYHRGWL